MSYNPVQTKVVSEKATLDTLPTEILALIVGYLAPDRITFPDPTSDIKAKYALQKKGDRTETYWSGAQYASSSSPFESVFAAHVVPRWHPLNGDDDLLNFARTNSRISEICDRNIYRNVLLLDAGYERIRNVLGTLTRSPWVLQPLVRSLSVRHNEFHYEGACNPCTLEWKCGIRTMLSDELGSLRNLRRVEIDICDDSSHRWDWYQLLSKLPALTHLFLRGFQYMECELPYLPQVKEAHFSECSVLGYCDNDGSAIRTVFHNLPSLHILCIMNRENVWGHIPEDVFEPFADTLHTLVWTGTGRDLICQNALQRLKNLKHLKSNAYNSLIAGEIASPELSNLFSTLETVEYVYPAEGLWDEQVDEDQQTLDHWQRMLRGLAESCELDYTSVRVVDVSSIDYIPSMGELYKCEAQTVFDAAQRRFEEIGVTCILPWYFRDPEPEPQQEPQQELQQEPQQGDDSFDYVYFTFPSAMEECEDMDIDVDLTDEKLDDSHDTTQESDDISCISLISDCESEFEVSDSEDDSDDDNEPVTSCSPPKNGYAKESLTSNLFIGAV
ncbi:hypothetical protein CcaCcLH18_07753 [Colletotrichum camelliae]|nr:hypothetical protein CcaCcLH18_07753 [Colletotrichum camelliae]